MLAELIRWYIETFETISEWQRSKQTHLEILERHALGKTNALNLTAAMLIDHVRSRRAEGTGAATVANDLSWIGVVLRAARSVKELPVRPRIGRITLFPHVRRGIEAWLTVAGSLIFLLLATAVQLLIAWAWDRAGDNDIDTGASARQFADRFTQFDRKVHAALPRTRIIFISIKPSLLRWNRVATIRLANSEIRDYCATHSNLAFLDIDPQMLGADGKPRADLLAADGIHMMPGGYRIWTDALKPLLR